MGTWGVKLNDNDISCDLIDMCNDVYAWLPIEEANTKIKNEYQDIINSNNDDYDRACFWLTYADWKWKHGILDEETKATAISLINNNAGLDPWVEEGSEIDIKKRIKVLNELKEKLLSPQPAVSIKKRKNSKPKHAPGDIIIFRTSEDKSFWEIPVLPIHYYYEDQSLNSFIVTELDPSIDLVSKYVALLCVGTKKIPCSVYLPNICVETSIYALYDYLGKEKPTTQALQTCGFLPDINRTLSSDSGMAKTTSAEWSYVFYFVNTKFNLSKVNKLESIDTIHDYHEFLRFHSCFNKKSYPLSVDFFCSFDGVFSSHFSQLTYLELKEQAVDNLLDEKILNPKLLSPSEIDTLYNRFRLSKKRVQ